MNRATYSRVQPFPSLDLDNLSSLSNQSDQLFLPNLENIQQLQGSHISGDHIIKIMDATVIAQKMGIKLAMDAINSTTCGDSNWKFISCFLDSTILLLDACNNIQLRLESIKNCLELISIGLNYLEGEHEPSKAMLRKAATALQCTHFKDKWHCNQMEKNLSRMRTFGKKLNRYTPACQDTNDTIIPDLYKALRSSWTMAILAIGVLSSVTSITSSTNPYVLPLKVESQTTLLHEPGRKMEVFQKKSDKTTSMEEFASVNLASQTLLKLISAWKKSGSSSLRRMAVNAVVGELKRRKEVLEKTLPLLENKIEEYCQQIIAIRISMFSLLPKARKEEVLEGVKHSSYESQMDINHAQNQSGVARAKVKRTATTRSDSLTRIRPPLYIKSNQNKVSNLIKYTCMSICKDETIQEL